MSPSPSNPAPQPQSAPTRPDTNAHTRNPTPETRDPIPLSLLLNPLFTLDQLAEQFNTDIEVIALWMQRPDIQQRIDVIEAASLQRARSAAHRALPAVATACHSIVTTFNNPQRLQSLDPDDDAALDHERRNAETARKAGLLLLRIARYRRPSATAANTATASTANSPARAENPTSTSNPTPATTNTPNPTPQTRDPNPDLLSLINSPEFTTALAAALNSAPPSPTSTPSPPPAPQVDPPDKQTAAAPPTRESASIAVRVTPPALQTTTPTAHPRAP